MRLISKFLLVTFFIAILSGCALLKGTPNAPIDVKIVAENIEKNLNNINDTYVDEATKQETKIIITKGTRDSRINSAFILIDLRYQEFVNNSGLQHRAKTLASEFTQLSLNLAGTAVGGAGLKTLLAALSAGISGTNLAFEKTFIYESTVPALIMQMNADRSVLRNQILKRMQQNISDYPWEAAVLDLIEYYNAGTLQNAISSIKKNAGSTQKIMDEELKEIKKIRQIPTDVDITTTEELTRIILNKFNDIKNEEDLKTIINTLDPLSQKLSHFPSCSKLSSESSSEKNQLKRAILRCIGDTGSGTKSHSEELAEIRSALKEVGLISN